MCIACNPATLAIFRQAVSRRTFLCQAAGLSGLAAAAAIPGSGALAQTLSSGETVIFRGGPIITMNTAMPEAEAIAIRGDRILAVGSRQEVEARAGSGAQLVDLDGRTLMPGLIDAHMHAQSVLYEDWIDVSAITSPTFADVEHRIRDAVSKAPPRGMGDCPIVRSHHNSGRYQSDPRDDG